MCAALCVCAWWSEGASGGGGGWVRWGLVLARATQGAGAAGAGVAGLAAAARGEGGAVGLLLGAVALGKGTHTLCTTHIYLFVGIGH